MGQIDFDLIRIADFSWLSLMERKLCAPGNAQKGHFPRL